MNHMLPEGLHPQPEGYTREELLLAMQQHRVLQARAVLCDERHALHVPLGCCEGVIERAEGARGIAGGQTRDLAILSCVGRPVCFHVLGFFPDGRARLSRRSAQEQALDLLSIFDMQDMAPVKAGSLPYGAQRRLEIVRALATNPSLLLLDEPAAGMNPHETEELMENIIKIRDQFHIAILLIEHDMSLVMGICEGIAVLNFGRVIAKGTPDEIRNNPQVIEAYLGKKEG